MPWGARMEGAKEQKWRADHVQPREKDLADEALRAVHATSPDLHNRLLAGGAFQPGEGGAEVTQAVARHTCGPGQVLIGDGVRAYGNDNHANAVVLPELAGIGPFGAHQVGSHRSLCNYLDGYNTPDVVAITYVAVHKSKRAG